MNPPSDGDSGGELLAPEEASLSRQVDDEHHDSDEPDSIRDALERKARTSRLIAWLLDECISIPGTKIRIGLDPILGLIPGGGETVSSIVGAFLLADASRRGIPFRTLFKMAGNMIVNAGIGAVPGVGDVFSVWFKSNSRNFELMRHYIESPEGDQKPGGWGPFFVVISLVTVVIGIVITLNITIWIVVWKLIQGWFQP
ncbi:MAG: DUF4112 domain-containing protein [Verrucomicrobiae bacterium]|nr:DUF4112 domain-containing protein [Verrucomicrobiae bacterium]